MTSNLLRSLQTLFGLDLNQPALLHLHGFEQAALGSDCGWCSGNRRFPILLSRAGCWWRWMIPLTTRQGARFVGCGFFHDQYRQTQPAKTYPWVSECFHWVQLKMIKGRWCCLPLAFRFYFMKKDIEGKAVPGGRQDCRCPGYRPLEDGAVGGDALFRGGTIFPAPRVGGDRQLVWQ